MGYLALHYLQSPTVPATRSTQLSSLRLALLGSFGTEEEAVRQMHISAYTKYLAHPSLSTVNIVRFIKPVEPPVKSAKMVRCGLKEREAGDSVILPVWFLFLLTCARNLRERHLPFSMYSGFLKHFPLVIVCIPKHGMKWQ